MTLIDHVAVVARRLGVDRQLASHHQQGRGSWRRQFQVGHRQFDDFVDRRLGVVDKHGLAWWLDEFGWFEPRHLGQQPGRLQERNGLGRSGAGVGFRRLARLNRPHNGPWPGATPEARLLHDWLAGRQS